MNELLSDARFWFVAMGLGLVGLVKYLWSRQDREASETKARVAKLEADTIRRKEFDDLRADFQAKHEENGERLDNGFNRIESLIERNHTDAVEGRHRVTNQILSLTEKVGKVEGRLGIDEFGRR